MNVFKQRVPLRDAPRADTPFGLPALAWGRRDGFQVYYVLAGRRRFAHELAHKLRGQGNDELHAGHFWHCCVLSPHALRLHDGCATPRELAGAQALLEAADGELVAV